jgi:dTDP-4-amino-4,6-dideoxygalactose transaminase
LPALLVDDLKIKSIFWEKYMSKLALLGGSKTVRLENTDMFDWPLVTQEHESAVVAMLRARSMSGTDLTMKFEEAYAAEMGMKYALACNNGTAAIHCALYGLGIGAGDEVICPSLTYWASIVPVYSLGATPVFADIDPDTLCVDPKDIQKRITNRTKAIIVVHYASMPADMDAIMEVAERANIAVFEDGSHAHAATYRGKLIGTFGKASGFSLMSGKALAIGEGGIMFTNDQRVYERAILFGHYERHGSIQMEDIKKYAGIPCGGYKYRMHQASSAFGLIQLKHYKQQFKEIDMAMNYFCDLLEDTPGIKPIRPARGTQMSKGGWYFSLAHYRPDELGGLSVRRFAEAICAEGSICSPGCNKPLHLHPLFSEMDVYGHGKPTRILNTSAERSIREQLPVTEAANHRVCTIPWFKHFRPEIIKEHAYAFKKVCANFRELLSEDNNRSEVGGYSSTFRNR